MALGVAHGAAGRFVAENETGLAASYPGDRGIEDDPDVVFAENFEAGSVEAVVRRWENHMGKDIMSLDADRPEASGGLHSLLMTDAPGGSSGAHLYRRLLPGYSQLYVRFYTKFDRTGYHNHHFVWLGGYNPPTAWPQGGAGTRPSGAERFTVGVEPSGKRWAWDFYTYWMEMRSGADRNFWGNDFINDPTFAVRRGEWICVELMVKLNDPSGERNGEQQFWIDGQSRERDGQIISHVGPGFPNGHWVWDSFHANPADPPFEGLRFRKDESLKINFLWLENYITGADRETKVWFDDVVVAKRYIGPIRMEGGEPRASRR